MLAFRLLYSPWKTMCCEGSKRLKQTYNHCLALSFPEDPALSFYLCSTWYYSRTEWSTEGGILYKTFVLVMASMSAQSTERSLIISTVAAKLPPLISRMICLVDSILTHCLTTHNDSAILIPEWLEFAFLSHGTAHQAQLSWERNLSA